MLLEHNILVVHAQLTILATDHLAPTPRCRADRSVIRAVKDAVKIPVIGNGDVDSPQKAKKLLEETGCDGVMIGRGAQGNPWIFRETIQYLQTGELPPKPTNAEKRELVRRHAQMEMECKGEYTAVREMRRHLSWYTFGMPGAAKLRGTINQMETMEELFSVIDGIFS